MNAKLSGLFSGFPAHHFTDEIALVLRENLPRRESLVFISAWPEDIPCDGIYRPLLENAAPRIIYVVLRKPDTRGRIRCKLYEEG